MQIETDCVSELSRSTASRLKDGRFALIRTGKMWGKKVSARTLGKLKTRPEIFLHSRKKPLNSVQQAR
jgi:hypothetical protein